MKPFFIKKVSGELLNLSHITYMDIREQEDSPTYCLWAYIAQANIVQGESTNMAAWPVTSGDKAHCEAIQTNIEALLHANGCLYVLEGEAPYWLEEVDVPEEPETETLATLYDSDAGKDTELANEKKVTKKVSAPALFQNQPAQFYDDDNFDMGDDMLA